MHCDPLHTKGSNPAIEGFILDGIEAIGALDEVDGRAATPVAMYAKNVHDTTVEHSRISLLQLLPAVRYVIKIDGGHEGIIDRCTNRRATQHDGSGFIHLASSDRNGGH